jgi:diguanylate cyclase (GGDEF)-like protein
VAVSKEELNDGGRVEGLGSYRRLADVFQAVLSERGLDAVLDKIAEALSDLIPYDSLVVYQAAASENALVPVMARDQWADEILSSRADYGHGITGWVAANREPVLTNQAHLDPRTEHIPGTPDEPEALISVPLVCRRNLKGVLNIYRVGEDASFAEEEFDLAKRFGDAAALALDNAQSRASLERLAHTDSLTGLYNHRFFHERLRAELTRATRANDSVALLMLDLDDFKRVNDVFGHGVGDHILESIAMMLSETVRGSDVACRVGGEELALIMPSCDAGDAIGFARRLIERLDSTDFDPVSALTVSIGIAQGPQHAMNPRELLACAEAAMMTVKARGKNGVLVYEEGETERPGQASSDAVRSIAHLKMLQSLSSKLNQINDVRQIGTAIANELRTLIDYHNCRVYGVEDDYLIPVAFRGQFTGDEATPPSLDGSKIGEGISGRVAATKKSLLVPNALECEFAVVIPGTQEIEESIVSVPMLYGSRTIGAITISKLGKNQFDQDDVRLLEVLSAHASVALENARLYEAQRREAESARALLECADSMAQATTPHRVCDETVAGAARLLEAKQASLWMQHERTGEFTCVAQVGYVGDSGAEAAVRARVSPSEGEKLLKDRKEPFVLGKEDVGKYFTLPDGASVEDIAIAPLHGTNGWIKVRRSASVGPAFTEQHLRLLAGLSYQTSVALEKSQLYKGQKEEADVANALLDFGRRLAGAEGIRETLDRVVQHAARILGSPKTVVWLEDPKKKELVAQAAWGFSPDYLARLNEFRLDVEQAESFTSLDGPTAVRRDEIDHIPGVKELGLDTTVALAPLKLDGERVGFIMAAAPALGDYEFSDRKMRLLAGIAHQSALAINSGSSFESLEETFISTVEALANALEAKDQYTSSHARWITDTSIEVGMKLKLDPKSLKRLELGALFHDIGKIGVPNSILLKPGPLTDEEWRIIRKHPEMGEKILEPIERLADVRPIVRHCHEHYDGGGYPDGLAGKDIPIESRIILVVDAFHAMTSDRPYRKGMDVEEAYRRLCESSGTQFDPDVVDALMWVFEEQPKLAHSS